MMRKKLAGILVSLGITLGLAGVAAAANVEVVIGLRPGKVDAVDPIVSYGQRPSAHQHAFFGAIGIDEFSTPESLQGTATTAKTPGQTSEYWIPTSPGHPIYHAGIYYSNRFSPAKVQIVPFGTELVIGAGHVAADGKASVFWTCSGKGEVGTGITKSDTPLGCPLDRDTLVIRFPNCWDGQPIDTAPGKDNQHFAYSSGGPQAFRIATGGVCPAGFPVKIAQTNAHFRFRNAPGEKITMLSSGPADTAHGDFLQSWVTEKFQEFVDTCLNDPTKTGCTGVF